MSDCTSIYTGKLKVTLQDMKTGAIIPGIRETVVKYDRLTGETVILSDIKRPAIGHEKPRYNIIGIGH